MKNSAFKKKDISLKKSALKQDVKKSSPIMRKLKVGSKKALKGMLLSPLFHTSFKVVAGFSIFSALFYGSYLMIGQSFANEVVISQSEIIARAGKLTPLPQDAPKEIVRVQDPDDLRKQSDFFKDIKEGDYILMYENVAVIYDLRNDRIVAVKEGGEHHEQ